MELLILASLIVLNGIFAMSEMAIVAARKTKLEEWAREGRRRAATALGLANAPSHFLSTIQIGITLIGVLAGAYGGARLSAGLAASLSVYPWIAPYAEQVALGIVVLAITYFSLIIGELVPKRLALHNPEAIASLVAGPMAWLAKVAHPIVRVLSASTDLVLRLIGSRPSEAPPVTDEEIRVLMEQGTRAGVFEKSEQTLVRNVLRLDDRVIASLMTPRIDIVYLELDDPVEMNLRKIAEQPFSRYPVCQGGLEHLVGLVHTKAILKQQLGGQPIDFGAAVQQPLFVPESASGIQVLETFRQSGVHAALVVDEYGEIHGLVTLHDMLTAIVGEITSLEDQSGSMVVRRSDGSWLIDGMLDIASLKELLQLEELPAEDEAVYHTLGGLMMAQLGRVPRPADHFEWRGLRFEVVDMDGKRVDKVLVSRTSPAQVVEREGREGRRTERDEGRGTRS
jgi:putative hemolysin